ncbi:hypothetical protein M3172_18565 [Mesobacillus subterraneus]|uniref:hypothetical protein n=1 Tax=Mesobacillus subterraneus TaxID=285983 RepID=UPI00203D47C2|nr:hypothetical protein [Mesobacillus subterraneus]MCM3575204.1 hypothetical protein [Mesobacillus subterraneus]
MGIFLTIAAGAGILFAIAYFSGNERKKKVLLKENIPACLGLLDDVPASAILNKLKTHCLMSISIKLNFAI